MEEQHKPYPTDEESDSKRYVVKEPPIEYGVMNPIRYTYADYLSWMDEKRREIIDGVVYDLFGAPTRSHSEISGSFFGKVWNYVFRRKRKCKIYHAPFDVRIPKYRETADNEIYTVVQPDICVVCDPKKLDDRGCIGAPDLIVEVQSPSTAKRDLDTKFYLYESAGVKEYWVVFPKDKAVTVFLLQDDGKYNKGTTYEYDAQVPVSILKGLTIALKELFED
jgi:Uma2 family endonuclease